MSWTYDVSTDIGKVRLLCTDIRSYLPIFQDEEIQAFLVLGGSVRLAAAMGLETIAVSEVLIQKVMKTLDVQTDGAKQATELRALAKQLRDSEAMDFGTNADFAIAEQVNNTFQWRERVRKQFQRGAI